MPVAGFPQADRVTDLAASRQELVGGGKMTNRAFHDAMYHEGNMPVEMVRLALNGQKVTREYRTSWKFYGPLS